MADVSTLQTLLDGKRRRTVLYTNTSDGTGKTSIVVDRSGLTNIMGNEPAALRLVKVNFCIQGFPYVRLHYDHDTDQTIAVLSGTGKLCFDDQGIRDLGAAGGTGDLLLTAPAGAATGSCTVLMELVW